MQHLFVNKDLSLLLKEKGFDDPCFAYWFEDNPIVVAYYYKMPEHNKNSIVGYKGNIFAFAPLYQQVIDWFREKHNIDIYPISFAKGQNHFDFMIVNHNNNEEYSLMSLLHKGWFRDFYEGYNKAIEEALKLI